MTHDVKEVLKRIEELRRELHEMLKEKTTQDLEVLAASQRLDKVLNDYYRLTGQKRVI
jgi:regulator of replication initiation timing